MVAVTARKISAEPKTSEHLRANFWKDSRRSSERLGARARVTAMPEKENRTVGDWNEAKTWPPTGTEDGDADETTGSLLPEQGAYRSGLMELMACRS